MNDNNIISVITESNRPSREDFDRLMLKAEDKFNVISKDNPNAFYKMGANKLEKESEQIIQSVCDGTIFKPEDVVLVSGHAFPDIQAGTLYGVEVKSTEGKTWTSTGSSIVESTRISDIDCIYMLFGKLGSNPPEFKCRPYESVLKGISVTHSPRYTIDMTLGQGQTIFDQMGIPYDDFRRDEHKIDIVRDYYRKKTRQKSGQDATQWWLGKESPVNLEIMRRGFDSERKKMLVAEMLLLFDEIILGEYGDAAAWLCTRRFIINPSFRDMFSAGGTVVNIDGEKLSKPFPHIVGCILEHIPYIKKIINLKDEEFLDDIRAQWKIKVNYEDILERWKTRTQEAFSKSPNLNSIDIVHLILAEPKIQYSN